MKKVVLVFCVLYGFLFSVNLFAGDLYGWGANHSGQLGDGTTLDSYTPVKIGNSNDWKEIAAGWYHTISIKTDGSLWAWGLNDYGQLGDGTKTDKTVPIKIGNSNDWRQISTDA